MTCHPARFYGYVFFEVPFAARSEAIPQEAVACLFDKWAGRHRLRDAPPPETGLPDLSILRFASAENNGLNISIIRCRNTDILKVEWPQNGGASDDLIFAFLEKAFRELKNDVEQQEIPAYIGCAGALYAHSGNPLAIEETEGAAHHARIPACGDIYRMDETYLLVGPQEPAGFLGRDFPLMLAGLAKLARDYGEYGHISDWMAQNENEAEPGNLRASRTDGKIEVSFSQIREYQLDFMQHITHLARLKHRIETSLLSVRSSLEEYNITDDTLFEPELVRAGQTRKQVRYDVEYARLTIESMETWLQALELEVSNKRLRSQRRLEFLVIALMLGLILVSPFHWPVRLLIMLLSVISVYCIIPPWFLYRKDAPF